MTPENLLLVATSANPRIDFPIEQMCSIFSAAAATFWLSGEIDKDEMVLTAAVNRPDLDDQIHKAAFSIKNSFISDLILSSKQPFLRGNMDEIGQFRWDNDELLQYTREHYREVLFIAFLSRGGRFLGLLHLYFTGKAPRCGKNIISLFANVFGSVIETFSLENGRVVEERRKIGHEIGRLITNCEAAARSIQKSKSKGHETTVQFSDLQNTLRTARAASENATFAEGVLARKEKATFIPLRRHFVDSSNAEVITYSRNQISLKGSANIPFNILVRMNPLDLDLLISNLVSNAAKYSPPGGSIKTSLQEISGYYRLHVSNPSNALPEAEFERVWRFGYRGVNSKGVAGDGVGLTVIKDICNAYSIRHKLSQDRRDSTVWTDVTLDFPRAMCRWTK